MEIKRGDVIDIDFDPARGHEIRTVVPPTKQFLFSEYFWVKINCSFFYKT